MTATLTLNGRVEKDKIIRLDLLFNIIQSEQMTLSTEITDHIVEDHTTVQDHITIKPIVYTLRGLISEKVFTDPRQSEWNQWIEYASNKLTPLKILAPTVNSYVQSAINLYEAIEGKIESIFQWGTNAWETIKNIGVKNDYEYGRWAKDFKQSTIIKILYHYMTKRIPVEVNTGWGFGYRQDANFFITDISVNQGNTYQESELSVTVKQLRFTTVQLRELTEEDLRSYKQDEEMQKNVVGNVDNKTDLARRVDEYNHRN